MEKTISCKCEKCKVAYEKPLIYKKYVAEMKYNFFWLRSLQFCDKCRREREIEMLNKSLPKVLKALAKNI